MGKILATLVVVLTLVAGACAAPESETASAPPGTETTTTETPDSTMESATESTVPSDDATSAGDDRPLPEGDPAPDFTLALGESGAESFVLSQEVRPVFMVFWAEW